MGKSKRKSKLSAIRCQSWPILATKTTATDDDHIKTLDITATGAELMQDLRQKLRSDRPSDRHLAADMMAHSLANFTDDYTDKDIAELIRTVSPMCLDRVENCRNAAIDCLCHLSSLSDKLVDLMISADVMTPLIAAYNQYFSAADWLTGGQRVTQLMPQIYINLCRLLTNLCGTSDTALKVFNNSNLSQILINGLRTSEANIEVAIASAQCLSVVAEDNPLPVLSVQENLDLIKCLLQKSHENSSQLHLSLLMAFIGHNLGISSEDTGALDLVFTIIDSALSAQCLPQMLDFAQHIQQFVDIKKDIDSLKLNYIDIKNLVLAKRLALELITNITGADGSGSGSSDDEDGMDCEDEDMEDSDNDTDNDNERNGDISDETIDSSTVSPQIVTIITGKALFGKIGDHLAPMDGQLKDQLLRHSFGVEIVNCIQSIQLCSLTCVHNLATCMSPETLPISQQVWTHIHSIVFNSAVNINTSPESQALADEAINTLRALISRYPLLTLTADDVQRLCVGCQSPTASMAFKINVINVMSVCAVRSPDMEFIERVSGLLLTGLEGERGLTVRAELFDALIDIFSEDHKTDLIAIKLNLITRMKSAAVLFRKEANKSPVSKTSAIISTVKLNLMPFLKYKQKMLSKTTVK